MDSLSSNKNTFKKNLQIFCHHFKLFIGKYRNSMVSCLNMGYSEF